LDIHHLKYKQNPCGNDNQSYRFRMLLGRFGALANELTMAEVEGFIDFVFMMLDRLEEEKDSMFGDSCSPMVHDARSN